jgi:anti-sigma regulatory factor (Ser/Thr protein kinase)
VGTSREAVVVAAPNATQAAELVIGNRLDELGRASAWLDGVADTLDLPTEMRFRLDLGLTEAVTNVIAYAYQDSAEHEIRIRLGADGPGVTLEVEDDGIAFDPLRAAGPPVPASLAEAKIGGLGIHLIRSMLDECHYHREAGKNRLTMVARPHNSDASER